MSDSQKKYLNKIRKDNIKVKIIQIFILLFTVIVWQGLSSFSIIDTFIFSSPLLIIKTIYFLFLESNLLFHIYITLSEIIISFVLSGMISFVVAIIFYNNPKLIKIFDPYITMLNSLPKVALGPLIIIWFGATTRSIIFMALLINTIVSFITIYHGFSLVDKTKLKLFHSFHASQKQILLKLIIPATIPTLISALKTNISMSFIGVIMGEFLVSKAGLGYLIIYGKQMFDLNLVMSVIVILLFLSYLLYVIIDYLDKKISK